MVPNPDSTALCNVSCNALLGSVRALGNKDDYKVPRRVNDQRQNELSPPQEQGREAKPDQQVDSEESRADLPMNHDPRCR